MGRAERLKLRLVLQAGIQGAQDLVLQDLDKQHDRRQVTRHHNCKNCMDHICKRVNFSQVVEDKADSGNEVSGEGNSSAW